MHNQLSDKMLHQKIEAKFLIGKLFEKPQFIVELNMIFASLRIFNKKKPFTYTAPLLDFFFRKNDICIFFLKIRSSVHHQLLYLPTHTYASRVNEIGIAEVQAEIRWGDCQIRENFFVYFLCLRRLRGRTKESDCHDIVLQRFIGFCVVFFFSYKKTNKKTTMQLRHATY